MKADKISKETGIAKNHVYEALKAIREMSFIPKRIRKVLKAKGKKLIVVDDN